MSRRPCTLEFGLAHHGLGDQRGHSVSTPEFVVCIDSLLHLEALQFQGDCGGLASDGGTCGVGSSDALIEVHAL